VAEYHARAFGLPREAIAVQNNPINRIGLLRPEPAILRRIRGGANGFTFVNVAQFWPAKAHALLLSSFAEVHARHPHTRLELLGEAVDARVAALVREAIARHGLEQAVELAGFIDRRALSHRLARAQALVQPSVYEGFSVAMAEAAHFALPIIATSVGGAVDLVRDNDCGILIPPHISDFLAVDSNTVFEAGLHPAPANRAALVAAMEAMVQDPAGWGERGFIGQARIDQLTPRVVAQRYLDLMAAG
jgi:glycosyltransferase involved in cell wall biosynthesis